MKFNASVIFLAAKVLTLQQHLLPLAKRFFEEKLVHSFYFMTQQLHQGQITVYSVISRFCLHIQEDPRFIVS